MYPSYDVQLAVEGHFVAAWQWAYDDDMWWVPVARGCTIHERLWYAPVLSASAHGPLCELPAADGSHTWLPGNGIVIISCQVLVAPCGRWLTGAAVHLLALPCTHIASSHN